MSTPSPYGSWPSTISARSLVSGAKGIGELVTSIDPESGDAELWWSESRPEEAGRTAIMRLRNGEVAEQSPAGVNVRTGVHEYGGAAWWADRGRLWYSDYADHRLWTVADGGQPLALTPEPSTPGGVRYADGRATPDGSWFVCVRETHHVDGEPDNELVAVAGDGSLEIRVLADETDFVSCPRLSADGQRLCWIQWSHPDMPWDHTELWVADFADGTIDNASVLLSDPRMALVQPGWLPDGGLAVVGEVGEWWNLLRWGPGCSGSPLVVEERAAEVGTPPWVFGMQRWAAQSDGQLVAAYTGPGSESLRLVNSDTACSDFSVITQVQPWTDGVVFVGAGWDTEPGIWGWSPASGSLELLRSPRDLPHDPALFPPPEHLTFDTSDGMEAHALWYPPAHVEHVGSDGERPPVLVRAHGGPTSAARRQLQLGHRYWTSRGIGVLDVDYRGSVGYGRTFRHALRGQWGEYDVDDCIAAVQFLIARGDVDSDRVAIAGGSAGGFTVLAALQKSDVFGAGASRYGVADLSALATDTHKFESRYLDRLIGPWPEAEDLYRERSPITHVDQLRCPMIVLQGELDKVVPPNQAEAMVDALAAVGVAHAYVSFPDEGHGFRSADNIVRALESELAFLAAIFGFDPADELQPLQIFGQAEAGR